MITGRALRVRRIRAGRAKPGLRRQHLACVEAAAQLCHAEVRGATLGSQDLEFLPHAITGGELAIDIGTAGSTTLVVQTILVPAIAAGHPLRAVIRGGTHNPLAPPFEFLDRVYAPHLREMGAQLALTLDRHGFASGGGGQPRRDAPRDRGEGQHGERRARGTDTPVDRRPPDARGTDTSADRRPPDARGTDSATSSERRSREPRDHVASEQRGHAPGQLTLDVAAGCALRPVEIIKAGPITARHAIAILARLPTHVADREHAIVQQRLAFTASECTVREVTEGGPANVLLLEIERAEGRELVSAFGEKGLRAELVANRACDELASLLDADVPVGSHLADQLLLPLAVAGGGRFRTGPLSLHSTTNIDTIQRFLALPIRVEPHGDAVIVSVG